MIPIALRILVCSRLEGWRCLDLTGVSFTYEWESPWFTMGRQGFSYSFELPPTAWNQHLLGDIDLLGGTLESVQLPCVVQGLPLGGGIEQRDMLHVESFAPGQISVRIELNTPFWDAADSITLGPMKALGGPSSYYYRRHSDGGDSYSCRDVGVPLRWWFRHVCRRLGYRLEGPQGQDGFPPVEYFLWWGPKQEETSVGEVLRAVCYRLGWQVVVKVGLNRVYVEDFHGNQHPDGDYYFRNDEVHGEHRRLGRLVNSHRYLLPVAATPKGKLAKLRMAGPEENWGIKYHQLSAYQWAHYEAGPYGNPTSDKHSRTTYGHLKLNLPWYAPQGSEEECDLFPEVFTEVYESGKLLRHALRPYTSDVLAMWDELMAKREKWKDLLKELRKELAEQEEAELRKELAELEEELKELVGKFGKLGEKFGPFEQEWDGEDYALDGYILWGDDPLLSRDVTYAGTFLLNLHRGVGNKCTYEGQLPGYRLREGTCPDEGLRLSYPHGYMRQWFKESGGVPEKLWAHQYCEKTTWDSDDSPLRSPGLESVNTRHNEEQLGKEPQWGGDHTPAPWDGSGDDPEPLPNPGDRPGPDPEPLPNPPRPDPHVPNPHKPDPHDPNDPNKPTYPKHTVEGSTRQLPLFVENKGIVLYTMYETQAMPEDGVVLLEEGQVVINSRDPTPQNSNAWAQVPQLLLHNSQRPTETNSYHYPLPRASWYYTALEGTLIEYDPLELLYHIEEFPLPGGSVGEASKALKGNQRVRHMSCTVTETTLTIDEVTAIEQGPYVDLKYEFEHGGSQFELERN